MQNKTDEKKVIDISKRTFLISAAVLAFFLIVAAVLTYIIPKGTFEIIVGENGDTKPDYMNYVPSGERGIAVWKALLSPVLIFTADGALQPLMLMIFLLVISGVFQMMKDCGAMKAIVGGIAVKVRNRKKCFLAAVILFFMALGSLFGLFEETLIVLPMIVSICISLGFDMTTGFIICTVATGFGFSAAITNPFTVVYASDIIGASVTSAIWFRLIIFAAYYLIVLGFALTHVKRLPKKEVSAEEEAYKPEKGDRRLTAVYSVFLCAVFVAIIVITSLPFLRDLSVPLLAAVFLIGGFIAGILAFGAKKSLKSFGGGALAALPALLLICLAFAVKYVLTEGLIIDTITNSLANLVKSKPPYATIFILFAIILFLEFFISSSTAKAAFVMGILSGVAGTGALEISPELIVLIYVFSDGFTNVIFPTSPVLLIGLSMTNQDYFGWLKRGKYLFVITFAAALVFLFLGLAIGY